MLGELTEIVYLLLIMLMSPCELDNYSQKKKRVMHLSIFEPPDLTQVSPRKDTVNKSMLSSEMESERMGKPVELLLETLTCASDLSTCTFPGGIQVFLSAWDPLLLHLQSYCLICSYRINSVSQIGPEFRAKVPKFLVLGGHFTE